MDVAAQEDASLVEEIPIITEIVSEGLKQPSPLLFMLHGLQDKMGYVSEDAVFQIAEALKVPTPEILSIVTFHREFRLKLKNEPAPIEARHIIRLCSGAPCYTKGSTSIGEEITKLLNIQKGEVTEDKKFAFEVVDCLGTCGISPVMMINDDIHGNLTNEKLPEILGQYT